MEDNEIITLSGRDLLITGTPGKGYRLLSGKVNVFVASIKGGTPGRRIFIDEVDEELIIPSLCCDAALDYDHEEVHWCFLIAPVSDSSLEVTEYDMSAEEEFCRHAKIENFDILGFEEAVLEAYRLEITRDIRNIHAFEYENTDAKKRSFINILNLFRYKNGRTINTEQTTSELYNAASAVCSWLKIKYVPLETITSACGRNFSVWDFARLSGFACREIVLKENWYYQDSGPVFAKYGKERIPIACLPKNGNRYLVYFGDTGDIRPMTEEIAEEIDPSAYMFYRPFPREKMDVSRIISFVAQDIRSSDIVSIVIMALLGIIIGLLIPYINEQIYDLFIPIGNTSALLGVGAVIIACTSGNVAFSLVQTFCSFRVTNRMKYSLEAASIDRLFNLPESFYGKFDSADLAKRAMSISQIFTTASDAFFHSGLNLIFSLVYLFKIFDFNEDIAWTAIIMLVIVCGIIIWIGSKQLPYEKKRNDLSRENASLLYQLFAGVNKLRIAGAEERGIARYMKGFIEECRLNLKSQKHEYWITVISTAASTVFSIVFYYLIVKSKSDVSLGKFMGFSSAFGALSGAALNAAGKWISINNLRPYFEKALPILEELPEKLEDVVVPTEIKGEIEVNNLTFGYNPDAAPIINGISFYIKPGEYIGLVGGSGSGKSTLLKLLLGFEKPQEGKIYYDGQDIDTVDKRELRKKFGVVLQNGGIITGSIQENITIARPNSRLKEIKEAIRMAGLEEDIEEMPMGMHTVLSEGSGGISGGQKQRILIARAIIGKPKVIFMDEATSALDNNTQAKICDSLDQLNATRVVIAHRLTTIMHCDRIFVLDHGKIAEEGTYDQLMEKHGLFYDLAVRQLS